MDFILFFLINLIRIVKYAILVRVLMSWMGGTRGRIGQIIHEITEPVLKIFRNLLPKTGMIDLSPLIAFFALDFAQIGIVSLFASL